jgi:hypothetical protein
MFDREKAMTDFINAVTRLDFGQLISAQASLSEHIDNIWRHQLLQKELKEDKEKSKTNGRH